MYYWWGVHLQDSNLEPLTSVGRLIPQPETNQVIRSSLSLSCFSTHESRLVITSFNRYQLRSVGTPKIPRPSVRLGVQMRAASLGFCVQGLQAQNCSSVQGGRAKYEREMANCFAQAKVKALGLQETSQQPFVWSVDLEIWCLPQF